MIESLYILLLTGVACSLLGVFLVLRNLSMLTDAISHSVLLGIVLAFFIFRTFSPLYLLPAAALFGIFSCFCIEAMAKNGRVSKDASIGIWFPLFFSLGVILITRFAKNIHIDTDAVLMGEVILAPFNRVVVGGLSLPRSGIVMAVVVLLNLIFILLFFRPLKISAFDLEFAGIAGNSIGLLHYAFMGMVSLTAVAAFESVGAIMTISFFVTPAACACLITKELKMTILIAALYAIINCYLGYMLALRLNVSLSGMCALLSGLSFLLTLLFHPRGLLTDLVARWKKKRRFHREMLLLHMSNHRESADMYAELGVSSIRHHMRWSGIRLSLSMRRLMKDGYVYRDDKKGVYVLTKEGIGLQESIRKTYGL